jgi:iron complex transport system substrate-binding protein
MFPPSRIVCLTEETVETLYLLASKTASSASPVTSYARHRLAVSAFTSANIDKIITLKPDLVLTFSDLQADIAADLIRRGLCVHAFNQQSVAGILDMIRMLGAMVDESERARQRRVRSSSGRSPKPLGMPAEAA